jgi:hypothetical protein
MPFYIYANSEGETKEVFQSMSEPHVYSENGEEWKRVFTVPQASIDTKIDPFSRKDFVDKTANKKGTMGGMMDLSAELSEARAEKTGHEDPVKRQLFNDYEKKNKKKHIADKPKIIETSKVKIEF